MSQKTARARRQAAGPVRFEVKALENEIRDIRAAQTIERREALKVELAEIKKERAEARRGRVLGQWWSSLLGRWL
ncbi:hypothetical protein VG1_CDS0052 [Arthrobacter phage Cupello]|nr:hypothetical protein VG1_CDS0052 [Arthrobacter phage Cupello]